jgi:hypothetical protein
MFIAAGNALVLRGIKPADMEGRIFTLADIKY